LVSQYSTLKMQHISTELSSPRTKLQGVISQKIATSSLINYLLTKRSIKPQGEMSSTSAWMLLLLVNTRHLQSIGCYFSIHTYCQYHKIILSPNTMFNKTGVIQSKFRIGINLTVLRCLIVCPDLFTTQSTKSDPRYVKFCQNPSVSGVEDEVRAGGRTDNKTRHFNTNPHRGVNATFRPPQQRHNVNWLTILDTKCSLAFSLFLSHS